MGINLSLNVKMINKSPFPTPAYGTSGSSGMDLRANIEDDVWLNRMDHIMIPTGIYMEIPEGYEIQIRPRSGLAKKYCVFTVFGTIDSDYRGEIWVNLLNLGKNNVKIKPGERIAQAVLCPVEKANIILVHKLEESDRGAGGFGSTGMQ